MNKVILSNKTPEKLNRRKVLTTADISCPSHIVKIEEEYVIRRNSSYSKSKPNKYRRI